MQRKPESRRSQPSNNSNITAANEGREERIGEWSGEGEQWEEAAAVACESVNAGGACAYHVSCAASSMQAESADDDQCDRGQHDEEAVHIPIGHGQPVT